MAKSFSDLVSDGMDVYDADDQKVGTVADVFDATARDTSNSGGGYLRVPTGFLGLGREHHIPFSAIRDVSGERIYLGVLKDELDNLGFDEAPMATDDSPLATVPSDRQQPATTLAPLTYDEIRIERHPIDASVAVRPVGQEEITITVPLREERVTIEKRVVVYEEVEIGKRAVEQTRRMSDTVRREEIVVEQEGRFQIRGDSVTRRARRP